MLSLSWPSPSWPNHPPRRVLRHLPSPRCCHWAFSAGRRSNWHFTGTNLTNPTGLWTSFPAKVTIPTEGNNGKQPTSLKVRVEVPKDAPLGFHSVRLATRRGMSNARLFCIDDLVQVTESADNQTVKTAQQVKTPCVVVGKAKAETTAYFKFVVKANQSLSFDILGRRLGSAFDPQITLLDASGKELPAGFSNDCARATDRRPTRYTFKNAGDYIIAVRDVSFRAAADFHYRLRIGDFPVPRLPYPWHSSAGPRRKCISLDLTSKASRRSRCKPPTDPLITAPQVAPPSLGAARLARHGAPVGHR